jgi:Polysaccharide pyruvyl transferase
VTRVLIRSGKDPFTPVSAEATLTQNVFHTNVGNYLYTNAVHRALSTTGTEIVSNGTLSDLRAPEPGDAERINDEFDRFVVPLANAFRPAFERHLVHLTSLIEGLTVPVTVIGVGAQAGLDLDASPLASMADPVRAFVRAVLDRSASIGVRGEFTQSYLVDLGFPAEAIDIIGCPSLFTYGDSLRVHKQALEIGPDSHLSMNLSPDVPDIGPFSLRHADAYPHLVYVMQDREDLELLLYGTTFAGSTDPAMPTHTGHPLYQQDRMRMFLDGWTWIDHLATQDFVFGTRFHGNVAALLAGVPAILLTHDSRTAELADYHGIPQRPMAEVVEEKTDIPELYDAADFSEFNTLMPQRFATYRAFLDRNELPNIFSAGESGDEFDARVAAASFPGPVKTLNDADGSEIASRLRWLRDGERFDARTHKGAYAPPFPHPVRRDAGTKEKAAAAALAAKRAKELAAVRERVAAQKASIKALEQRLAKLERNTLRARLGRLKRRLLRR